MALLKLSLLALAFLRGSQRQTWSVTIFNQRIKTEIRTKFKSECFTKQKVDLEKNEFEQRDSSIQTNLPMVLLLKM